MLKCSVLLFSYLDFNEGTTEWVAKLNQIHLVLFFQAVLKVLQPFNPYLAYFYWNCWHSSTVFRTQWHSACCKSTTCYCPRFRQWRWGGKRGVFKSLHLEQHCTELLRRRREKQRSSGKERDFRCGTDGFLGTPEKNLFLSFSLSLLFSSISSFVTGMLVSLTPTLFFLLKSRMEV